MLSFRAISGIPRSPRYEYFAEVATPYANAPSGQFSELTHYGTKANVRVD